MQGLLILDCGLQRSKQQEHTSVPQVALHAHSHELKIWSMDSSQNFVPAQYQQASQLCSEALHIWEAGAKRSIGGRQVEMARQAAKHRPSQTPCHSASVKTCVKKRCSRSKQTGWHLCQRNIKRNADNPVQNGKYESPIERQT